MNNNTKEMSPLISAERRNELLKEIGKIDTQMDNIARNSFDNVYDEMDEDRDPEEEYRCSPQGQLDDLYEEKCQLEEIIYKSDWIQNIMAYSTFYKVNIENYSVGNILSDVEVDLDEDIFSRKSSAKAIADFLCNSETKSPFNIGILAKWGEGKTTFLKYIKEAIGKNKNKDKIRLVSYNASEYDEKEQIWANLANLLFKEYEKESFPKTKYYIAKLKGNRKQFIEKLLINIFFVVVISLMMLGSKLIFEKDSMIEFLVGFSFSLSSIILLITKIIMPFFKSAISSSISLSNKVVGKMKLPDYIEKLGTRAQISEEINILLEAWIPNADEKVIIFVDELDRCTEKGIVEFFQSIQLLINNKKLFFVFAIDGEQLKNAFKKHYEIPKENINSFTNDFLEKYVSVIVPLHNNVQYNTYIESLVKHAISKENKECFELEEVETIKKCIDKIPQEYLTPRKVKKIVNLLILIKEYCVREMNTNYPIDFREFITWFIFASIYKEQAKYIVSLSRKEREYVPLKKILNSINKEIFDKSFACKAYIVDMEFYVMHNILVYNHIASFFTIDAL